SMFEHGRPSHLGSISDVCTAAPLSGPWGAGLLFELREGHGGNGLISCGVHTPSLYLLRAPSHAWTPRPAPSCYAPLAQPTIGGVRPYCILSVEARRRLMEKPRRTRRSGGGAKGWGFGAPWGRGTPQSVPLG